MGSSRDGEVWKPYCETVCRIAMKEINIRSLLNDYLHARNAEKTECVKITESAKLRREKSHCEEIIKTIMKFSCGAITHRNMRNIVI
jgi:hypothetical protein